MYVPLYIKTHYSFLSSMIKIEDLIEKAKKSQIHALSISDTNLYGAYEFYKLCKQNDIKPIIGLELQIFEKPFVLYAKNEIGYQHLLKLVTIFSDGNMTIDVLKKYFSDLILVVPFQSQELLEKLSFYSTIYQGYTSEKEKSTLKGENILFFRETLCLEKEDQEYLPFLHAIRDGVLEEKTVDSYLMPEDKVMDLSTNYQFCQMCNLEIHPKKNLLPSYPTPDKMDCYTYLKKLCIDGLRKKFGNTVSKVYQDRLKYELSVIEKMGFCDYFLVVWDYVRYAKKEGILVGPGRGSAAGSLVSYLLDIITIDPLKYDLLFERFLNPERITMPDIDIDFEDRRRMDVISYCISKYGKKRVVPIITFGTLGAKQVLRDVGKALGLDSFSLDYFCRMINSKWSLTENYQKEPKIKNYLQVNKEFQKLYKIALKLEGLKRHSSIHASGVIMSSVDLDEVIPLENHKDFYISGYSMGYLEELGLLKMDFLALSNLSTIKNILEDIDLFSFDEIPLNDAKTFSIFSEVNTVGIFQFESTGMMNFLRKLKPDTFEDLYNALALYRPGPMDNIDLFIARRRKLAEVDYIHESLKPILKSTYGIIVYQEQIMQIASLMASYSLGGADVLRRAMSKKKEDILVHEKEKFVHNSIENGYTKEVAEGVYDLILKFANYGFNKSHSVAYAMVAYKMAYLKAHYPTYFLKSLLSMVIGNESKTKEYIYEAYKNKISLLKPDINVSGRNYLLENNQLRFPLNTIRNIGESTIQTILDARRNGTFKDIFDFILRMNGKLNRRGFEVLIDAGCFDSFSFNHHTLKENMEKILNYSEIGDLLLQEEQLKPVIEEYEEYSKKELMEKEVEVFGFYLSNHPVIEYKKEYSSIDLIHLSLYYDKQISVVLYVDKIREVLTKKGEAMAFLTGSDELASVEAILFPSVYEKSICKGDIVFIKGHVERRFDKYQIVVKDIQKID